MGYPWGCIRSKKEMPQGIPLLLANEANRVNAQFGPKVPK